MGYALMVVRRRRFTPSDPIVSPFRRDRSPTNRRVLIANSAHSDFGVALAISDIAHRHRDFAMPLVDPDTLLTLAIGDLPWRDWRKRRTAHPRVSAEFASGVAVAAIFDHGERCREQPRGVIERIISPDFGALPCCGAACCRVDNDPYPTQAIAPWTGCFGGSSPGQFCAACVRRGNRVITAGRPIASRFVIGGRRRALFNGAGGEVPGLFFGRPTAWSARHCALPAARGSSAAPIS